MNQFVNPKKRDISLPAGCKDLIEVLGCEAAGQGFHTSVTDAGFIITAGLPSLRSEDIEITVECSTVRIIGKRGDSHAPFEAAIHVPFGFSISTAHAAYSNSELRITIPKSAVPPGCCSKPPPN